MRILFLSQVLPFPLDAGPKVRSCFVLRHLVQQHQVTLLTFVRGTDQPEDVAHLEEFCDTVHTVPLRRKRLRKMVYQDKMLFFQKNYDPVQMGVLRVMLAGLSLTKMGVWSGAFVLLGRRDQARKELCSHLGAVKVCWKLA